MTDKSDDRVGHLNTILARGGGNLNNAIFKSSNARASGGGMLKFRVGWRITTDKRAIGRVRYTKNQAGAMRLYGKISRFSSVFFVSSLKRFLNKISLVAMCK